MDLDPGVTAPHCQSDRSTPHSAVCIRGQDVELLVALGGVTTVDLVRTIEVENATRPECELCASH